MDVILQAVRAAGKAAVLPRFRTLGADQISQKTDFADLVTVADTEAEALIGAILAETWPEARVLGEEAVAADPSLRAAMAGAGWQVIVDPVDGTWNFAKGISTFGMIAVAVQDGVAQYGLLYDPLLDDWVEVRAGGPARFVQADGRAQVLAVSGVSDPAQMCGFIPVGLFAADRKRAAVLAGLSYGRVTSLRCSCHEYRLMAQGHVEFVISGPQPHPWDHAAGVLAVQAAGGVARFLDGAAYDLARRAGVLLVANSEATWSRVATDYAALAG
ncbi:inositol monophosphatase family protein [Cypionkella psychrotolerans]|uniref:inositol monophosphatase family protein n=1 Tax=Cypionkella psychrotolerans TaxID=1678131 RepID=UPI0006B5F125|nr:inositol monophosphatase [Cypionkella psychrotolerans]